MEVLKCHKRRVEACLSRVSVKNPLKHVNSCCEHILTAAVSGDLHSTRLERQGSGHMMTNMCTCLQLARNHTQTVLATNGSAEKVVQESTRAKIVRSSGIPPTFPASTTSQKCPERCDPLLTHDSADAGGKTADHIFMTMPLPMRRARLSLSSFSFRFWYFSRSAGAIRFSFS